MTGYDLLEAMGEVEECLIEEAEMTETLTKRAGRDRIKRAGTARTKRAGTDRTRRAKTGWTICAKTSRTMRAKAAETGRAKTAGPRRVLQAAAVLALLIILPTVTALASDYFSGLRGDELAFERVEYLGDGIVAIRVRNDSNKTLEFQEEVKLGIFYANEEIAPKEGGRVRMQGKVIAPKSSSELLVDLSEAYDIEIAGQPLVGDSYYLLLTNTHFFFGESWPCMVDFQNVIEEGVVYRADGPEQPPLFEGISAQEFLYDWTAPVENLQLSNSFGRTKNGRFSDHIVLAGTKGEDVFAVADGSVSKVGFETEWGHYIVLDLFGDAKVRYGHLEEVLVSENQTVKKGETIARMGQSGQAAGPCLLLALYVNDRPVNPIRERFGQTTDLPEIYAAKELLAQVSPGECGVNVPMFLAYDGAVYGGCDFEMEEALVICTEPKVMLGPEYVLDMYEIVGHSELVAIVLNGGYQVYRKLFDTAFQMDGAQYRAECRADSLGADAAGEALFQKNGMEIYRAVDSHTGEELSGKYFVDVSQIMSECFPELFGDPREKYADCFWIAGEKGD